jgi:hypothetical protein
MTDDVPVKDPATFEPDFTQTPYANAMRYGTEYLGLDVTRYDDSNAALWAYWDRADVQAHYIKRRKKRSRHEPTPEQQAEIDRLVKVAEEKFPTAPTPGAYPFWPLREGITLKDLPQ